jgi:hypothetical protein
MLARKPKREILAETSLMTLPLPRWFSVVPALFVFLGFAAVAGAQPGFSCVASEGVSTIVRGEGLAELVGDTVITCTGGTPTASGQPMPQVTITVFLNTNISSRITGTVGGIQLTEALLTIDEPTPANQSFCTTAPTPCSDNGNGTGQGSYSGQYNVFQATVSAANAIAFNGIPIDPPGATGSRTIRITNIRSDANQLGDSTTLIPSQVIMFITATPGQALPIGNPDQQVGAVEKSLMSSIVYYDDLSGTPPRFDSAAAQNPDLYTGNSTTGTMQFGLKFREGFNTAFRTRLSSGQDPSTPGAPRISESGFVNSTILGSEIGFATQGTRFVAQFSGVPAGIRLFATTVQMSGSSSKATAALISGTDSNGAGGTTASAMGTATYPPTGETQPIAEIPVSGGAGTAVWEVTGSDPVNMDWLVFGIVVAYQANQPGLGTASMAANYGPLSAITTASATDPAPRFAAGYTPQALFTIKQSSAAPAPPSQPQPADGAQGVLINPASLSWTFDSSADSNDVYYGTANPPPFYANTTLGAMSLPAFNPSTVYYWKVVSKNSYGSTPSPVWSFRTLDPPAAPTLLSPANGAPGLPLLETLTWNAASGATSYGVYFGTSPTPPLVGYVAGTVFSPMLAINTTYYWQIAAVNNAGTSPSPIWSFTTGSLPAPGTPVLSSPANGAPGVSVTPTLSWQAASNAASYDVYLGATSPPVATVTGTTYTPPLPLVSNTAYSWQIVANNASGTATSTAWSFTTAQSNSGGPQFTQQGAKLTGSDTVGEAEQGYSVALSADGNTAIMGAPGDNTNAGSARVFTRTGGVWTQQGSALVGAGATVYAEQGFSAALSADGNTALVGGPNDGSGMGAAWVFTRSGGVWMQQGSKLVASGGSGITQQGRSVALSADGNTAILGGIDNNSIGGAWVFTRSGGVWTQQGTELAGSDAVVNLPMQFPDVVSVALSADGNTAIVGWVGDSSGFGAAWVFTRSGGTWTQQGAKLAGSGAVLVNGLDEQGISVALSADGNTAVVGGYGDNDGVGAAWVFTRSGGAWAQQGAKLVATGAVWLAKQGESVALSADGNTALVGGPTDNSEAGATWVFTRVSGVWVQQGAKLVGTDGAYVALQGNSVALSADGHTAIVGGNADNSGIGAAWIYTSPPRAKIGTYNAGNWSLDMNGNGGASGTLNASFGWPGATYITGDWNGDGHAKIGVYYNGFWYLDYDGNGVWDGGVVDKQYVFGWADPNVIPVVGDWNGDGRTKIGIYYQGFWYLDYDGNGVWDGGVNDKAYNFGWPAAGVTPILGDWSASGTVKIGIYYQGFWYLDYDGNGVWDGGVNDKAYMFGWAATGVTPIVGDWNGDQRTKIGIYYNGLWYLDYDGNGVWDGGVNDKAYVFGQPGVTPLLGDWSGTGTTKIGMFHNGHWYLDFVGNGVWDGGVNDKLYSLGQAGDVPVVGGW